MKRVLLIFVVAIALLLGACAELAPPPTPEPTPAAFAVSDLSVDPVVIYAGDQITISVLVSNASAVRGSDSVTLTVNGEMTASETLTLGAGETETVSFLLVKDIPGTYVVAVNGLTRTLVVLSPAEFEVGSLTIDPPEAAPGEAVIITIHVRNVGDVGGTYEASLVVDDDVIETREVWIAWGMARTLTFVVFPEETGTYNIGVGGQSHTLLVVPEHFDLSEGLDKMPEFYTEELSDEIRIQYRDLVAALSIDAQKWIVSTGRFLEDKRLDANEVELLRVLSAKEDPLFYLTMPEIMYGVSSYDVSRIERDNTRPEDYMYLRDDVEILEQRGFISVAARESLDRIVCLAESDYELRKGLYLINHFGYPRATATAYATPDFNTQLFLLGVLLENGVPVGYERLAVAAALAYGTLITIGDEAVQDVVPDYAHSLIEFIADTDSIVKAEGAHWQAKYYPLEAAIMLAWGAPGTNYRTDVYSQPLAWTDVFVSKRMNVEDFNWHFVSIDTLVEKRKWMVGMGFVDVTVNDPAIDMEWVRHSFPSKYSNRVDVVMDKLNDYLYFGKNHFRGNPREIINVDGREVIAGGINSPDWQWRHFRETGMFHGSCGENTNAEAMLSKAISIASCHGLVYASEPEGGIYTHGVIWYYDSIEGMVRTTPCQVYFYETTGHPSSPPVSHDGYDYIPWDNFYASGRFQADRSKCNLVYQRDAQTAHTAFAKGYPSGYVFRYL